jgi:hypothetical protein
MDLALLEADIGDISQVKQQTHALIFTFSLTL